MLKKLFADKVSSLHKALLTHKVLLIQMARFGAVGVLNTALSFVLTNIVLVRLHPDWLRYPIAYGCGMITSYAINKVWTFGSSGGDSRRLFPFIAVNLTALGVATGALELAARLLQTFFSEGLARALGFFVATPVALAVNFIGNRLFVFSDGSKNA